MRALASVVVAVSIGLGATACGDSTEIDTPDDPASLPSLGPPAGSSPEDRAQQGGDVAAALDGGRIRRDPKLVTGYVDNATLNGRYVDLSGWAASAELDRPADIVAAVAGGASVAKATPAGERPDLVDGYDRPGLAKAGFTLSVPRSSLDCSSPDGGLEIYGIVGSAAAPLEWLGEAPKVVKGAC
jgi:hypothetical protein